MRLAAQAVLGFYPIDPEVMGLVCGRLEPPAGGGVLALDPCCGEGAALGMLAERLQAKAFGVELDDNRAERARQLLPEATILGPASFTAAQIRGRVGCIYLNPPFDDELGGGRREELTFTIDATWRLKTGGVLVLVLPAKSLNHNEGMRSHLASWYRNLKAYSFPAAHRRHKEIVVFGTKRSDPLSAHAEDGGRERRALHAAIYSLTVPYGSDYPPLDVGDGLAWAVPAGDVPLQMAKVKPTDAELCVLLRRSPLGKLLRVPAPRRDNTPPLPLLDGHRGMLLVGGFMDQIVKPDGELPHIVRGNVTKEKYLKLCETNYDDDGRPTTKEVRGQRISARVRVFGPGMKAIKTLVDSVIDGPDETTETEGENPDPGS